MTASESPPRMPGWVKWPAIVLGVLIAVLLISRFFGIQHGPGRHLPPGNTPTVSPSGHATGGGHG